MPALLRTKERERINLNKKGLVGKVFFFFFFFFFSPVSDCRCRCWWCFPNAGGIYMCTTSGEGTFLARGWRRTARLDTLGWRWRGDGHDDDWMTGESSFYSLNGSVFEYRVESFPHKNRIDANPVSQSKASRGGNGFASVESVDARKRSRLSSDVREGGRKRINRGRVGLYTKYSTCRRVYPTHIKAL